MAKKVSTPTEYAQTLEEIKNRVRAAQYQALKAVNRELISLYWDIGRIIVARQQNTGWGRSVVERLTSDLRLEFPGISGFSASNLWRMRGFYTTYAADEKLAPLVREVGWSHNVIIMERSRDARQREF
jgi:predicted nuclease of restriction endonuclease-like (RecB) superfamily